MGKAKPAILSQSDVEAIADLCARSIPDCLSVDELAGSLFVTNQPAIVRGDPNVGVVATVQCDSDAHIRLLVVDPDHRRQGEGSRLVRVAEDDARALGSSTLTTAADPPYYLWPGVPTDRTDACALFERHHYSRVETNYDVTIDLASLPAHEGDWRFATEGDRAMLDEFMATHWSNWHAEVRRALDKNQLVLATDHMGISAICAFEVNRAGFLGPVAVRPNLMGKGAGVAVLLGALWELRRRGLNRVDVSWVGPLVPYARVGGRISNVYFVYRRNLSVSPS